MLDSVEISILFVKRYFVCILVYERNKRKFYE